MRRICAGIVVVVVTGVSAALYGQVHIRTSVTITPKSREITQDEEIRTHKIQFRLWCNDPVVASSRIEAKGPCGFDTVYSAAGGDVTLVLYSPTAGDYTFYSYIKLTGGTLPKSAPGFNLSIDDNPSDDFTGPVMFTNSSDWLLVNWWMYGEFYQPWVDWSTPYSSGFEFSLSTRTLFYGQQDGMGMGPYNDCTNTAWESSDSVTLTIIEGGEYASLSKFDFDTQTDVELGKTARTTGNDLWYHYLSANQTRPDSGEVWVVVEAESNGMTGFDSVKIYPGPVVVTVTPSTLSPGDTATIEMKKRNEDGSVIDFSPEELFEAGVIGGEGYGGTILAVDGKDTSEYFIDIPAGFRFIADKDMTVDTAVVGVRVGIRPTLLGLVGPVGNQKNQIKSPKKTSSVARTIPGRVAESGPEFVYDTYGIGWVRVTNPSSLKLTVSVDPNQVRPLGTGGNCLTDVTVTAEKGGLPVPGIKIKLSASGLANTGGHIHDGHRPAGNFLISAGVTDGDGKFMTIYSASEFGGIERIYTIAAGGVDSVDVRVKVDSLIEFPSGGNYSLTGYTSWHPENHYMMSQAAIDDLASAAGDFTEAAWNSTGIMRLNDMSLPCGGLFDLNQNWKSPHILHRVGISVDIENLVKKDTTVTFIIDGKKVTKTVKVAAEDWLTKYVDLLASNNWKFVNEGQLVPNPEATVKYPHFEWEGD